MSIKVGNLKDVDAWSGGGLPEGLYPARVIDAGEGKSKGGFPQIELQLEVIEGDCKGGTIRDWIVITERSYGRVKGILEALGYEIPEGDFEINVAQLIGLAAYITVRNEPYQGQDRMKVKAYDPAPDITPHTPVGPAGGAATKDEDIPF